MSLQQQGQGRVLTATGARTGSVLTATVARTGSVLTATRARAGSVLASPGARTGTVLTATGTFICWKQIIGINIHGRLVIGRYMSRNELYR